MLTLNSIQLFLMVIFWFRRDLRLTDNHGLYKALISGKKVLPIFIFDKNILKKLDKNDARVSFIHQNIQTLQNQLNPFSKNIATFFGTPKEVFQQLKQKHNFKAIYCNDDYEPNAIKRDAEINLWCTQNNILFHSFKDQVVFEKSEITKEDGSPYVVYTPYSKKWIEKYSSKGARYYPSEENLNEIISHDYPVVSLEEIGFEKSETKVPEFRFSEELMKNYAETRDFPQLAGTSNLSTYLRFGTISIRQLVAKAFQQKDITFLKELIWREFFMQILWHFPRTTTENFKKQYDGIEWEINETHFKLWCEGSTGYPIVDAGMRELNQTGLMHNRVRMIVASFLCKHLLIDWRWGEAYFAQKLLDYELSSNVGNWQWAAGTGVDAAPYFRIFNPTEQTKKFDPNLEYVSKWVPEFQELYYPKPVVDHKEARIRCLERYKAGLENI